MDNKCTVMLGFVITHNLALKAEAEFFCFKRTNDLSFLLVQFLQPSGPLWASTCFNKLSPPLVCTHFCSSILPAVAVCSMRRCPSCPFSSMSNGHFATCNLLSSAGCYIHAAFLEPSFSRLLIPQWFVSCQRAGSALLCPCSEL